MNQKSEVRSQKPAFKGCLEEMARPVFQIVPSSPPPSPGPTTLELLTRILKLEERLEAHEAKLQVNQRALAIVQVVAKEFALADWLVFSRDRTKDVALARQIAIYFVQRKLKMSLVAVGRVFKRDHGTVIYAIGSVRDRISVEPKTAQLVAKLEAAISAIPHSAIRTPQCP